jgi:amidase
MRRELRLGAAILAFSAMTGEVGPSAAPASEPAPFTVVEAGISDMQAALASGRVTSRALVLQYLSRIATYEDRFHAALTVNPHALDEADAMDKERVAGKMRGPLHGIPIAIKDNIQTTDMPTTGGALAFDGLKPPFDATLVENLRAAGAIIVAKTGMTELANWVAGPPTPMPGNYNGLGGQAYNPYDPRRDPRDGFFDGRPVLTTGGSSSGVGTTANFWAANVGTETSGSILTPSNATMLAGIKPTVGRVSRYGVIPITADQDTPGPMAKTVGDAAILFGVLEGMPDPNDPATATCQAPPGHDYTQFLDANALKGARIGIPRSYFYVPLTIGPIGPLGGLDAGRKQAMEDAIAVLKREGAILVDPADIPSVVDSDPANNFVNWGMCNGASDIHGQDEHCSIVLKYGMKRDFNAWLKSLGTAAPVKTLTELRAWNLAHRAAGSIKYGQAGLDISDDVDLIRDRARYERDRAKDIRLGGEHGIDAAMKKDRLDAILFPGNLGAAIAARPGYPTVIVPFALVPNEPSPPLPPGFDAKPSPFGVSFTGMACSEPKLIALAYAFEQATKRRRPPASAP